MKTCVRCEVNKEDSEFRSYKKKLNKHCNDCLSGLYNPLNKFKKMREGHVCPQCQKSSPDTTFRVRKGKINKYCDVCNGRSNQWKKDNWSHTLTKRHEWLETQNGKHYLKTSAKKKWRVSKYGITNESFEALSLGQDNKCAICKKVKPLCVDHDHETGMVRALLCRGCNVGLGSFGDDPETIDTAVKYARHFKNWSYKTQA